MFHFATDLSIKFSFINRDFSRFSEECQGYGVVGFERVTSVRPSVRPRKRLGFGALDGVRAPSPRLLYSVGDWSMIQLNDSESLVSVLEGFSDHRARAPWRHTNLLLSPAWAQTHNPASGVGMDRKSIGCRTIHDRGPLKSQIPVVKRF